MGDILNGNNSGVPRGEEVAGGGRRGGVIDELG